ncbi:cation-translocating P-type ATPase [Desulfohalovibrio reitneri]|uniref:cation-translocating P-type ATPase n=1 Tax=Desulfohalovibrio reitneri TaxID=1307759 RepID=UPI0004A6CAAF|nr:cation-transporting P-type ATPase [Desulfohalovibrio reitneri]
MNREKEIWRQGPDEAARKLEAHPESGLTGAEARRRLAEYGPNLVEEAESRPWWRILLAQVANFIAGLLAAASVVSLLLGQEVEAVAIAIALLLNVAIGFFTEWRAERSLEALRHLGMARSRVVRGGKERQVEASELVPGDVLLLSAGDLVPADARVVRAEGLTVDESALTGESISLAKGPDAVEAIAEGETPENMLYRGTVVAGGGARCLVAATGMDTRLGEIAKLAGEASGGGTPLARRLERLGRRLVFLTLAVAAAVAALGFATGKPPFLIFETAVALAVAAIPEGLPVVATIALAQGMWRMASRGAVMTHLEAVETLGSTTVICTDKTGTLTENRMTVRFLSLPDGGEEEPDGKFSDPAVRALRAAVLANAAELGGADEQPRGDPMELALLRAGREAGLDRPELLRSHPEKRREPFSADTKMMATVHRVDGDHRAWVKGAPEAVLAACDLEDPVRAELEKRQDELARRGLRLLGLATKAMEDPGGDIYQNMEFLGFVCLEDPVREGVVADVDMLHDAGLRVVMVTGDHKATARAVAEKLDIIRSGDPDPHLGSELADLDSLTEEQADELRRTPVFARITPERKLDIVDLLQRGGQVVAMTGDGVNDAPALKKADIGVAMGKRGSQAAKQAADVVLTNDDFTAIAWAVEQGRVIFRNIRRFVVFLLSGNAAEVAAVALAMALGWPLPLLPLQILYLNMISDVFPALALGVGRESGDVMNRPPRDPSEPLLARRHWWEMAGYAVLIAAVCLVAFVLAGTTRQAASEAFLTLALARTWHVFNMRGPEEHPLRNSVTKNPLAWGAVALSLALLAAATYTPLAAILDLRPPTGPATLYVPLLSLVPLAVVQLVKSFWGKERNE